MTEEWYENFLIDDEEEEEMEEFREGNPEKEYLERYQQYLIKRFEQRKNYVINYGNKSR